MAAIPGRAAKRRHVLARVALQAAVWGAMMTASALVALMLE